MLSHATYFEKRYMLRFYKDEKRLVFYIIKQVLNEPPGWTRILKFWTRWQQKEPYQWQSLCVVHQKEKPPRDLEIEHVSPTVAFVYSHMLLWLWLSQLHWEDPCIVFRLTKMRELETLHGCLKTS